VVVVVPVLEVVPVPVVSVETVAGVKNVSIAVLVTKNQFPNIRSNIAMYIAMTE
jgi:hypothetical protein